MIGVTADITERKSAEAALLTEAMLRESATQLRELANAMPQIVFTAQSRRTHRLLQSQVVRAHADRRSADR